MTPRQRDVLRFIESYIADHDGVSPTFDEIGAAIGVRSKSGVARLLDALEERRFIRRLAARGRSIEILGSPPTKMILSLPEEENDVKTTVTETHEREIYAYLDRHDLFRLVARHVAVPHGLDPADKVVSFKIDFVEETEGSPAYPVGTAVKVRITVDLGSVKIS